jgi:hypothetical protein
MVQDSRWEDQDHIQASAYKNLQIAQEEAAWKSGYNSSKTRSELISIFCNCFRHDPYEWQLDVTEAVLLGLDSVVIAGAGAGHS